MPFFDRYVALCEANNYKPAASSTTEMLGITRATVTQWKNHGYLPNGKTLAIIADVFHVSVDYLLCRTDDPTDYSGKNVPRVMHLPADKRLVAEIEIDETAQRILLSRYSRLSAKDRSLVDGYMIALLAEAGRTK